MQEHLRFFTHDGIFHADEVFATAMLSQMCRTYEVVRGGDEQVPSDPDWIVYDIGGGELDHHTPENKERNGFHPETQIPYASCGLVWRKYYEQILTDLDCPQRYQDLVYQRLETSLVLGIDAEDNGVDPLRSALQTLPAVSAQQQEEVLRQSYIGFTVSKVIRDFNPPWNSSRDNQEAFEDAVSFAQDILLNRIDSIISGLDARDYIQQRISYSSGHVMILDQFAPWESTVYASHDPKAADIWYVIYPALRGGWNVQAALLDSHDRTHYRHPLPSAWYGLRGQELAAVCGVEGALFCHVSGFLCGAKTEADALQMASLACSGN